MAVMLCSERTGSYFPVLRTESLCQCCTIDKCRPKIFPNLGTWHESLLLLLAGATCTRSEKERMAGKLSNILKQEIVLSPLPESG